jgi:hypothetical protein
MNRGDKGDIGKRNVRAVDDGKDANEWVVGVGVRLKRNVGDVGDIIPIPKVELIGDTAKPGEMAQSNMDNGDAGMRGDAMRNSGSGGGGLRNGLTGDNGPLGEKGEEASESQYDNAGTGGVLQKFGSDDVEVVHGSGKVARRGVEGRGARHDGVEVAREMEAGRGCIADEDVKS